MKKITIHVILLSLTIYLTSCAAPEKKTVIKPVVPPVTVDTVNTIKKHNGKAVITGITYSANNSDDRNIGYVDIYFNFIPADPGASGSYLCRECPDTKIKLFYDNRDSFHGNWVKKWEIKPGNEYPAIRHEMMRKDKTVPVSYEVFLEPKNRD